MQSFSSFWLILAGCGWLWLDVGCLAGCEWFWLVAWFTTNYILTSTWESLYNIAKYLTDAVPACKNVKRFIRWRLKVLSRQLWNIPTDDCTTDTKHEDDIRQIFGDQIINEINRQYEINMEESQSAEQSAKLNHFVALLVTL